MICDSLMGLMGSARQSRCIMGENNSGVTEPPKRTVPDVHTIVRRFCPGGVTSPVNDTAFFFFFYFIDLQL